MEDVLGGAGVDVGGDEVEEEGRGSLFESVGDILGGAGVDVGGNTLEREGGTEGGFGGAAGGKTLTEEEGREGGREGGGREGWVRARMACFLDLVDVLISYLFSVL